VNAAGRLAVDRKKVVKALATSLGCDDTTPKAAFVQRLLELSTGKGRPIKAPKIQFPTGDDETPATTEKKEKVKARSNVSLHGALLIQAVLSFPAEHSKPIVDRYSSNSSFVCISHVPIHTILECLLLCSMHAQSTDQLLEMACDPTASRVVECMLTTTSLDDPAKRRFVDRFKGQFALVIPITLCSHMASCDVLSSLSASAHLNIVGSSTIWFILC
jgi:hypothetical protein